MGTVRIPMQYQMPIGVLVGDHVADDFDRLPGVRLNEVLLTGLLRSPT